MQVIKTTIGWVNQVFDTETKKFVSQEFVTSTSFQFTEAADTVMYEDTDGNQVGDIGNLMGKPEPYLPFDMVQPDQQNKHESCQDQIQQDMLSYMDGMSNKFQTDMCQFVVDNFHKYGLLPQDSKK